MISPRPGRAQVRQGGLRQHERGDGVHRDDPARFRGIGGGHRIAAAGDSGVVDQDRQRTEVAGDRVDHGRARVVVLDRGAIQLGPAAKLAHGCGGLVGLRLLAAVVDGDVGAGSGQRDGNRPADAPACACHQGHAPLERDLHSHLLEYQANNLARSARGVRRVDDCANLRRFANSMGSLQLY